MTVERSGGMILTGENQRTQRKSCLSVTLSTTIPTWTDLGPNPGICSDRLVTNLLSHGTALARRWNNVIKMDLLRNILRGWELESSGSGLYPVAGFGISNV
jgi:hypothetical protein